MAAPPRPDSLPRSSGDRDLRLARRLDAGAAPDGTDALHDALRAARPEASPLEAGASGRLWARVDKALGADRPAVAPDRAPRRFSRTRAARGLAAALVVAAVGVGLWTIQRAPFAVVAADATVTWEAPDGSTVTLRPHSRLVPLGDRAYRLEGEAFFAVAHDPERPFTVEAGPGTVRVLGTRFDVSTWGGQTDVFVEEGHVEVRGEASAVVLAAGEAATVWDAVPAGAGQAVVARSGSADAALDWLRGEAVFERETVRRVALEIEQHFGIRVALPPDVAGQTVSGVLPLDTARQALDGLGRILGGRFTPEGGGFRFVGS